jgi:hypothetical protein
VHGGQTNRIAAADYAMPTIVSTVQEIELLQLARWECMCVHVYSSLQQKALDAETALDAPPSHLLKDMYMTYIHTYLHTSVHAACQ